jgi:hypothetical protein
MLLHNLPWELLYDPQKAEFLSLSRMTPVVRSLEVARPGPGLAPARPALLRVLIVTSNPAGLQHLELQREQRCIKEAWGGDATAQVDILENARVETLREALLRGPVHYLHFMGHGDLDPTTGKARLFFNSLDGSPDPVSGETLATLLKDAESLRFVFLNACETARSPVEPEADALTALSATLVMGGVPAVLAMQLSVSDAAAVDFSQAVHRCLAAGEVIESAVAAGRYAVYLAHRDSPEWAIPVLFTRLQGGHLFTAHPTGKGAHHAETIADVSLEGTWLAEISFPDGEKNWHRMALRQEGMEVTAESICYEGYAKGFRYLIQGKFRRQILACIYTIDDKTRIEQGSMVLMLGKDGRVLKGILSYYDNEKEEIASTYCELWREDEDLKQAAQRQQPE